MSSNSNQSAARISDLDAVILCGGRGRRLQPLTDRIPKPMVPFHGRPMLDHIIDLLSRKGLSRFKFCLGYKGDVVQKHYETARPNLEMGFSSAGEEASILRRLWSVRNVVEDRFICIYGDTFIDLDIDEMLRAHISSDAKITIVTTKVRTPFGLVNDDQKGWVTAFEEKPLFTYYIGSFIANRSVLHDLDGTLLDMPDGEGLIALFSALIEEKKLGAFEHVGTQMSFNTLSEKQRVEEELGRFYTVSEER